METGHNIMNFEIARSIFEHSLDCETRVSTALNLGLLNLINKDLIELTSQWVSKSITSGERVWMTSDMHFLHANIIRYSNRPFYNVSDMTGAHIQLLLGSYQDGIDLIRTIPAKKILVVGNHDMTREGICRYVRGRETCLRPLFPFFFGRDLWGDWCLFRITRPSFQAATRANWL